MPEKGWKRYFKNDKRAYLPDTTSNFLSIPSPWLELACIPSLVERTVFVLKNKLSQAVVIFCVALQIYWRAKIVICLKTWGCETLIEAIELNTAI